MIEIEIELEFHEEITHVCCRPLACSMFDSQIKDKIVPDKEILIKFPDRIEAVAISFMQGLRDCATEYGVEENMRFYHSDERLQERLYKSYSY